MLDPFLTMQISVVERVGMLWVRCRDGVSHSPFEFVEERDVAEAATVVYQYVVGEMGV